MDTSSIDSTFMISIIENLHKESITLSLINGNVRSDLDDAFESLMNQEIEGIQKNFDNIQQIKRSAKISKNTGIAVGIKQNDKIYNNVKNNMDGRQGHGTAAEYANNAIDQLTGKDAIHLGSDNAKDGPDRVVEGIHIQCKYCESAKASVGKAFDDNGQARYLNNDGTMMQIEVPRDQYNEAIQDMQNRIQNGQVPSETDPQNATKYVRKGHITYEQAFNVAGSGSIESISIDLAQGVVCSIPGAGLTAVFSFASAVWNGQDLKEAAKISTLTGLEVLGKNAAIFALTMQFSRGKVVNPLYDILKKMGNEKVKKYSKNYVSAAARNIAKKINTSSLAKSTVGKKMKLDKVDSKKVASGTVTAIVVYGPDICKAFQGKISGKQLIKNSTVNTASLIGATLGTAIPIPFVGSMIGGAVASFITKKVLDNFIEDDSIIMFRIAREEFLDTVTLYSFNQDEFDKILSSTIAHPSISKILQNMYQSGEPQQYIRTLITAEIQGVLKERKRITDKLYQKSLKLFLEEKEIA